MSQNFRRGICEFWGGISPSNSSEINTAKLCSYRYSMMMKCELCLVIICIEAKCRQLATKITLCHTYCDDTIKNIFGDILYIYHENQLLVQLLFYMLLHHSSGLVPTISVLYATPIYAFAVLTKPVKNYLKW